MRIYSICIDSTAELAGCCCESMDLTSALVINWQKHFHGICMAVSLACGLTVMSVIDLEAMPGSLILKSVQDPGRTRYGLGTVT